MTSGIYVIKNHVSGKVYVGQSANLKRRFSTHKRQLRKGEHYNTHLQSAFIKYGEKAFTIEVLCECERSELDDLECYYIDKFDSTNPKKGYNKRSGGQSNYKVSDETKAIHSKNKKDYWDSPKGDDERIKRMIKASLDMEERLTGHRPSMWDEDFNPLN